MAEHISGESYFQNDVEICVLNMEHHGKVSTHEHPFFELVYVDSGFSMHSCDNTNMVLTPGDFFFIVPGQCHSYISAYHAQIYNCLFMKGALDDCFSEMSSLPGLERIFGRDIPKWEKICLDISERQKAKNYLERMRWECLNKPLGWRLKLKSLLCELLIFYARAYNGRSNSEGNHSYMNYVYSALEFISNNAGKDIMVRDIAKSVGISTDYLTRNFKTMLGISPMEYLKSFRLAKAMELLKTTEKSVSEISSEVGFTDISHFSRQFKQSTGISPTEYRKSSES